MTSIRFRGSGKSVCALIHSLFIKIASRTIGNKTALTVLSELLQDLVKLSGVWIQAICPGFTYSEFHDLEKITRSGFKRSWFPKEAWMEARDVVEYSLNLVKRGPVMVVPGDFNINNAKKLRETKLDDYLNLKIFY